MEFPGLNSVIGILLAGTAAITSATVGPSGDGQQASAAVSLVQSAAHAAPQIDLNAVVKAEGVGADRVAQHLSHRSHSSHSSHFSHSSHASAMPRPAPGRPY